ncbi:S8 family peptidase [Persicobacter diffluens]|uniref:Peptidase S8/S53 domain-containing protein n=1 Tax=Persicobacter diffluens TaxID=981 RepID=A0AAN4W2L2_9BACT|nr:hypothetical protein PEDI_51410 [Persicobacter diffluens]GJM65070.1 hypothetical protein PEDI_56220 [Persicobacter diffluens]
MKSINKQNRETEFTFQKPKLKLHKVLKSLSKSTKEERINWAGSILNIPAVWQITQGKNTKVAVLDTGIDESHPDLKEAIIETHDFTNEGINDNNGHGTHCAGIIGARLNNFGFVGVAPQCELLIGKVLGNNGGSNQMVADGIYWATDNGADIISMSLGGPYSDNELFQAIHYALFHGKTVICAAGNSGKLSKNSVGYPGKYGGVITVASHDENGNVSGFSSRGGELDFTAPGSNIWSTFNNGGFAELSGTSMATPFVAGLAALILSKHKQTPINNTPLNNCEDMRQHLMRMATHPGYFENSSGYGPLLPFEYFYDK